MYLFVLRTPMYFFFGDGIDDPRLEIMYFETGELMPLFHSIGAHRYTMFREQEGHFRNHL